MSYTDSDLKDEIAQFVVWLIEQQGNDLQIPSDWVAVGVIAKHIEDFKKHEDFTANAVWAHVRRVVGVYLRSIKSDPDEEDDFVKRHAGVLDSKANAFFSVNIVARKPNKNMPDTNPYLKKFIRQIAWRPKALAVFAGKIDYPRYGIFDRWMIRFIMLLTTVRPGEDQRCAEERGVPSESQAGGTDLEAGRPVSALRNSQNADVSG